jgi:outer membrane protein assembly factor BamB
MAIIATTIGCVTMKFPKQLASNDDDWSMEAGGVLRTNRIADTARPPYRVLWEFDSKAGIRAVPLVRDSIIFLGNMRGDLVLFDLKTGKSLGGKSYGLSVEATPALVQSLLYVPFVSEEGVIAIDIKSGSVRWEGSLGPVKSSPLVIEERVYVAALSGKVHCLNRYTGEQFWTFTPEGDRSKPIRSSPAYADGSLFVGGDDGRVLALDASNGSLQWSYQAGGSIFATPVIAGSQLVVTSLDSTVYALNRSGGGLRWRYSAGSIFYGPAATDGQFVYVGAGDGTLSCIALDSGDLVWEFSAASVINSAPLVTANAIIVGSLDRSLYILEKSSGQELWRFDFSDRLRISPVLWRGYLIVALENRTVSVLVPDNPEEQ